jgi:hypothetical protein
VSDTRTLGEVVRGTVSGDVVWAVAVPGVDLGESTLVSSLPGGVYVVAWTRHHVWVVTRDAAAPHPVPRDPRDPHPNTRSRAGDVTVDQGEWNAVRAALTTLRSSLRRELRAAGFSPPADGSELADRVLVEQLSSALAEASTLKAIRNERDREQQARILFVATLQAALDIKGSPAGLDDAQREIVDVVRELVGAANEDKVEAGAADRKLEHIKHALDVIEVELRGLGQAKKFGLQLRGDPVDAAVAVVERLQLALEEPTEPF